MSDVNTNRILTGDCLSVLQDLPDESIHAVMTSPPYWQLRDYGHDDQLGLEPTREEYIQNIADVMNEVKRVLRDDGSLWLNLGDTYDDKDLQQIPARVALELQRRGWTLRNRVTWAKPNPMPQSVKDRLNDTTEAVFHFVKKRDYWYDLDAIREDLASASIPRDIENKWSTKTNTAKHDDTVNHQEEIGVNPAGKNPGDVFEVTTKPFPEAHFAVYPPELCEKPIKATCPPTVCAECGSPYEREVEYHRKNNCHERDEPFAKASGEVTGNPQSFTRETPKIEHKGWTPTCDCDTDATEPGIALDPFAGAGTTLLKAKELGRRFVGIELNPEYADMARARVGLSPHDPANVRGDDNQQGLEAFTGADE